MGFYVVGSNTTIHNNNKPLRLSPCLELKNTLSSVYPGNETAWILTRPRVYPADLLYPAASGGESVIRLSLGKLLVNQLQVVKRTNTPLKSLTNGVVDRLGVFWVVGSSPTSTIINFFRLSLVELENNLPGIPRN